MTPTPVSATSKTSQRAPGRVGGAAAGGVHRDATAAQRRLDQSAAYFQAHGRAVGIDHCQGNPERELIPYAQAWSADLIVAGNSSKNLILRRLFGETALRLLRDSPLPLYLAQ